MKIWLARPSMDDYYTTRKVAGVFRVPVTMVTEITADNVIGPTYALEVTSLAVPLGQFAWTRENLDATFVIGATVGTLEPEELDLMDGVIRVEQFDSGYLSTVGVASILMYQAFMAGPNKRG